MKTPSLTAPFLASTFLLFGLILPALIEASIMDVPHVLYGEATNQIRRLSWPDGARLENSGSPVQRSKAGSAGNGRFITADQQSLFVGGSQIWDQTVIRRFSKDDQSVNIGWTQSLNVFRELSFDTDPITSGTQRPNGNGAVNPYLRNPQGMAVSDDGFLWVIDNAGAVTGTPDGDDPDLIAGDWDQPAHDAIIKLDPNSQLIWDQDPTGQRDVPLMEITTGGSFTIDNAFYLRFGPDQTSDGFRDMYVSNRGSEDNILVFDGITGAFDQTLISGLNEPTGFVFDGTDLYLAELGGDQILRYDLLNLGAGSTAIAQNGVAGALLNNPPAWNSRQTEHCS